MLEEVALPADAKFFCRPLFPFTNDSLSAPLGVWKRYHEVNVIRHDNSKVGVPNLALVSINAGPIFGWAN
jgi:hypothetical protein